MKKLISILGLFLLLSCGDRVYEQDVVISVIEFKKGRYDVQATHYSFCTDSTYRIGDTLKIGKK